MAVVPPAILFVNDDLSPSVKETLIRQLFINQVLDGATFDSYVAADPSWPDTIKQFDQRVMVIRTFADRFNVPTWDIPDVVIFIKNGLASIEINKGQPGFTVPVLKLDWGYLLQIKPLTTHCCRHHYPCTCSNRQFWPGHHFDGMTHQYTHHTVFKPKAG